jgi:hypothetical protein
VADLGELRDLLVYEGQVALTRPLEPIAFTGDPAGDALLNDLAHCPHALLFGCPVDRQVSAERAWTASRGSSRAAGYVRDGRAGETRRGSLADGYAPASAAALALRRHGDRPASRYAAAREPLRIGRFPDLERHAVECDLGS